VIFLYIYISEQKKKKSKGKILFADVSALGVDSEQENCFFLCTNSSKYEGMMEMTFFFNSIFRTFFVAESLPQFEIWVQSLNSVIKVEHENPVENSPPNAVVENGKAEESTEISAQATAETPAVVAKKEEKAEQPKEEAAPETNVENTVENSAPTEPTNK
jgi:hypothetical protein